MTSVSRVVSLSAFIVLMGVMLAAPRASAKGNKKTSPAELLIRREQETRFMELLTQLPVPQRSVLLLHFIEDFSLAEIAGITETGLGTVKSRMHYAKKALRKLLEENP